jgi:ubiquinone biosynthesis monooxygenase Coq7
MNSITPPNRPLPRWLEADLRTDHAGETGAVMIYTGILACCSHPEIRAFAQRHRETERGHLSLIETQLLPGKRSYLLPLWRLAGFLTGAIPALAGANAVYATIDAVETFVDHHYQEQIDRLDAQGIRPEIRAMLEHCRTEEVEHRDEAREAGGGAGALLRIWVALVASGSRSAVAAARWF